MPKNDKTIEAVEKALGEPASAEFTDNTWKIRTNLIVASVIGITVSWADLQIDSSSSVLGLKFAGLNDSVVRGALVWIVGYLLAHFLWSAFDSLLEWRLRVTGTRVAFVTTGRVASEHADYPGDPRKSTLYNWWKEEAEKIGSISQSIKSIEELLKSLEKDLDERYRNHDNTNEVINACASHIHTTNSRVIDLNRSVDELRRVLESQRIPVSLQRFDRWFQIFLRSQNLRWLVIEFGFPIMLGAMALRLLCR